MLSISCSFEKDVKKSKFHSRHICSRLRTAYGGTAEMENRFYLFQPIRIYFVYLPCNDRARAKKERKKS